MRAHLLLALLALSACDAGAKPEARQEPDTIQLPPVIIVTKSEITYEDAVRDGDRVFRSKSTLTGAPIWSADDSVLAKLEQSFAGHRCSRLDDGSIRCVDKTDSQPTAVVPGSTTPCAKVLEKMPSVLYEYEPRLFSLAMQIRPTLAASCAEDGWSEPLKACILASTPKALVRENACSKLVSPELSAKIAGRFGLAPDQVHAMLVP
jgi:hypothetical protein